MGQQENNQKEVEDVPMKCKVLVGYLYFIQGIFLILPSTLPYTFSQLPSYHIFSLFSSCTLPFSFKFIFGTVWFLLCLAPLIEKYTSISYGRRKTWVTIGLMLAGVLTIGLSTIVEDESKYIWMVFLLGFIVFLISLEDISTDALAIKQLRCPHQVSLSQSILQQIGIMFGSLIFLQSISNQILTAKQFIQIVAALSIIPAIGIHFTYKERVTQQQKSTQSPSLLKILKHYKHFVNPKYMLFRQGVTFLFISHGLIYFISSYDKEIIKHYQYSKEMMMTLANICILPSFALSYLLSKIVNSGNIYEYWRVFLFAKLGVSVVVFTCDPSSHLLISIALVMMSLLESCDFYVSSVIVNTMGESEFSGLCVTMMASTMNLGRNATIQLKVIDLIGYKYACMFGFTVSLGVLLSFKYIASWIKRGANQEINAKQD